MKTPARTRAHYMQPDVPEERANRLWEGIVHGGEARRARRRVRAVGLTAGLLAAALALVVLVKPTLSQRLQHPPLPRASGPSSLAGRVFDGEERAQQLVLPDGSTVVIEAATRLVIVDATEASVRLRLDHGRITCDVTPRPERPFVVLAGDTEVRVKGTRFSVGAQATDDAGPSLEVHVERGIVEVGDGRGVRVAELRAGETWMKDPPEEAHNAVEPWPSAPSATTPPPPRAAPPRPPRPSSGAPTRPMGQARLRKPPASSISSGSGFPATATRGSPRSRLGACGSTPSTTRAARRSRSASRWGTRRALSARTRKRIASRRSRVQGTSPRAAPPVTPS